MDYCYVVNNANIVGFSHSNSFKNTINSLNKIYFKNYCKLSTVYLLNK